MKELYMFVSNFRNVVNVINELCQVIRSLGSTGSAPFPLFLSLPLCLFIADKEGSWPVTV